MFLFPTTLKEVSWSLLAWLGMDKFCDVWLDVYCPIFRRRRGVPHWELGPMYVHQNNAASSASSRKERSPEGPTVRVSHSTDGYAPSTSAFVWLSPPSISFSTVSLFKLWWLTYWSSHMCLCVMESMCSDGLLLICCWLKSFLCCINLLGVWSSGKKVTCVDRRWHHHRLSWGWQPHSLRLILVPCMCFPVHGWQNWSSVLSY